MLVSLSDVISYDVINVKNFREILRYFFYILATPLYVVALGSLLIEVIDPFSDILLKNCLILELW